MVSWAPAQVWSFCRREFFSLTGIRTADRPARNAVTIPNTLCRIVVKWLECENNHPSPKVTTTFPARPHDMAARTQVTKLALCYVRPYGRVQHCGSKYGRKAETLAAAFFPIHFSLPLFPPLFLVILFVSTCL